MHTANGPSNKGLSRAVEGAVESHERGVEIGNHVYTQQVAASGHLGTEILMHHQEVGVRQPPDSFAFFIHIKIVLLVLSSFLYQVFVLMLLLRTGL